MREPRIYLDHSLTCSDKLTLPEAASQHLSKVLRKRPGEKIWLFNGHGGSYLAEIISIKRQQVDVILQEFQKEITQVKLHITLAQGISRTQHMDYTLQKAVELGVTRIVPIITEFGNVQIEQERREKKSRHWQKIMVSACEQCGRNFIPELLAPIHLDQWLDADTNKLKLLLQPGAEQRLSSVENVDGSLSILSGAEGGFSPEEVEQALAANYVSIDLGPRILRTETAALAAISMSQLLWGDMG